MMKTSVASLTGSIGNFPVEMQIVAENDVTVYGRYRYTRTLKPKNTPTPAITLNENH